MSHMERRYDLKRTEKNKTLRVPGGLWLSLLLAVSAALGGCGGEVSGSLALAPVESEKTQTDELSQPATDTAECGALLIYICGEVERPGVYELPAGSRICDAVDAAGGMTDEADREYWNLAEPLSDGQMISFPTVEEAKSRRESAGASSGITVDGRVNINTAGLEELMTIPGVGKTRGEAILAYRSEHGVFEEPGDITKVSGIGEATFERMKDCIAVK